MSFDAVKLKILKMSDEVLSSVTDELYIIAHSAVRGAETDAMMLWEYAAGEVQRRRSVVNRVYRPAVTKAAIDVINKAAEKSE